jgi:hypothetical protein
MYYMSYVLKKKKTENVWIFSSAREILSYQGGLFLLKCIFKAWKEDGECHHSNSEIWPSKGVRKWKKGFFFNQGVSRMEIVHFEKIFVMWSMYVQYMKKCTETLIYSTFHSKSQVRYEMRFLGHRHGIFNCAWVLGNNREKKIGQWTLYFLTTVRCKSRFFRVCRQLNEIIVS